MEALIAQAKRLASTGSEAARKSMMDQFRDLSYSLETPDDTLQRVMCLHLEIAAIRVGIDLKLFNILATSKSSSTLKQLQQDTGAAPVLLGRLLRYLSSMALIKEPAKDTFLATNVTQALALSGNQAGVHHLTSPTMSRPFHQDAWKASGPVFVWLSKHPQSAAYFNQYMLHRRKYMPTWLSVFPMEAETKGMKNDVLSVDIGGNIGHQCAEFKAKYRNLPGRIVLQDLPHVILMALQTPGVENIMYDIFTPQPIRGAKFYYIRAVLHDFPDDKCRIVLKNIESAVGEDSILLINEMLLPDENVHWHVTQIDLTMMTALASIERTQLQWVALLDSVGTENPEDLYLRTFGVRERYGRRAQVRLNRRARCQKD